MPKYCCPSCKEPARFIERCESDESEVKTAWTCERCDLLFYVHAFDHVEPPPTFDHTVVPPADPDDYRELGHH